MIDPISKVPAAAWAPANELTNYLCSDATSDNSGYGIANCSQIKLLQQ
jgi:hypothetical protein